jgi:hypothetical protein
MHFDARSAAVMRKAARGPAEIALRNARASRVGALQPINRNAGVLVRGGSAGTMPRGLGALGAAAPQSTGNQVAVKTASGVASYAAAGAIAGPVGLVVGAIIGIVITKIFSKQYLDVTSANNIADASYAVFNQYKNIAGQVPGRQLGLAAMNAIWKGALYSGLFPLNNQQLCFHNGCLKYRGQPEWIEATINGPDNAFTLGTAYRQFVSAARAAAASPAAVGAQIVRTGVYRGGLRGFGALGAINGVPEAVVLVDNYLIPANTRDNPAWLVPRTALEHQILYDVADAWLAEKHPELPTTPYVLNAPAAAYPVAPPAGTPVAPAPPVMTAPPASTVDNPLGPVAQPGIPVNTGVIGPAPGPGGAWTFSSGSPSPLLPATTPAAPIVPTPPTSSPLPLALLAALAFLPGR